MRTVFCNLTPQKQKQLCDIAPATYAMFKMGSWEVAPHVENLRVLHQKITIRATFGGLTSRCRAHPPKARTVMRIPTSSIPVTVVADSPGRGWGYHGGWGGGGVAARTIHPRAPLCSPTWPYMFQSFSNELHETANNAAPLSRSRTPELGLLSNRDVLKSAGRLFMERIEFSQRVLPVAFRRSRT